jgi:hypothetical protein
MFAESQSDESRYFQVPGRPSTEDFQSVYWRCVAVFFGTSFRQQPDARHILYTNINRLPTVDGIKLEDLLNRFHVEIVELPLTYLTPHDYYHAYRNQFYVFDIARDLSQRVPDEAAAILLDSDCVWIAPANSMMSAIRRDGALVYVENYAVDWPSNGLTRYDMSTIASELMGTEVTEPLVYCGGELVAATGEEFQRIVAEIDVVWPQLLERHASGKPTFNEEGHTLSYVYHRLGYPLGNAGPYIRRISTGSFGAFNSALPNDHGLVVWHVPLEKRLGIRRLFPIVADERSRFWSIDDEGTLRRYLGEYVGVHENSVGKQLRDLGRRVIDKTRHRRYR